MAGHSYFGASSEKGTLLIKLSTKYPQYAIAGSLHECAADNTSRTTTIMEDTTRTPNAMACAVARSRNKPAVLRVGGGELFDHVYRAVSFDWNDAQARKYHVVGGGAGTVSAVGGWMASGGLSGTTGMRMYGIGIDQVVHMEAVLPDGRHVRWGPTAWEPKADGGYPRTTEVTGFCNTNPYAMNETEWVWEACDGDDIDFGELWFAFRGGGGGSYGVLTSLHYQLHEYPGMLSIVGINPLPFITAAEDGPNGLDETTGWLVGRAYVEFVLLFLYSPSDLNVTETESRGCSSAHTANMNVFTGGIFFCYGSSGDVMAAKWREKIENERAVLEDAEFTPAMIDAVMSIISNTAQVESYAHLGVSDGSDGVPAGRLRDEPRAGLIPLTGPFPNYADSTHTHFPLATFQSNFSTFVDTLAVEALTASGPHVIYAMGGAIPESDDSLNSLSPTRRQAAFLKAVTDEGYRGTYYSWFFPNTTAEFPGSSCHNHANVYDMGPLKTDWTKPCPGNWSQEERIEKCISQQEAAWGTANLNRLEAIKAKVDPDALFICTSGVGHFKTPTVYTPSAATTFRATNALRFAVAVSMIPLVLH